MIYDHETGEMVPSKYRISKAAWFDDEESEIVSRITQRIADMTGLSMETAENLQVVNYGIGGHYAQHYDFTTVSYNFKYILFKDISMRRFHFRFCLHHQ